MAKDDEKLDALDFKNIFQSFLPAGTYEECLYFVPVFLGYIEGFHRNIDKFYDYELEFAISEAIENFLSWVKDSHADLCRESQYDWIIIRLCDLLNSILSEFVLIKIEGDHIVPLFDSWVEVFVVGALDQLSMTPLKAILQNKLLASESYSNSAWLLDICSYSRRADNLGIWSCTSLWEYKAKHDALAIIFSHLRSNDEQLCKIFWERSFSSIILSAIA